MENHVHLWRPIWREGLATFLRRIWVLALIVAFGILVTLAFSDEDSALLIAIRTDNTTASLIAGKASWLGDWPGWAAIAVVFLLAGKLFRKVGAQRAGIACLFALLVAGATNVCFRPTMGRPRPSAHLPDGFYGPSLNTKYHAFMSGHSAASFAAATALVITAPVAGVPALAAASVIAWSRMQLNKHHPSDVLVGTATGIFCGCCFGAAARRRGYSLP